MTQRSDLITAVISLAALLALSSLGCSKTPEGHDLQFYGDAKVFSQTQRFAFNGAPAIENSMVIRYGSVISFFDPAAVGSMTMADLGPDGKSFSGERTVMTRGARFSYVLEYNGKLYNFVTEGHVYLYSSLDGITWTPENNGDPVFTARPGTPYAVLWNVAVDVDSNGVWHLLVEAATEEGSINQAGVGLGYSYSNDALGQWNFESRRSENHVIPKGGNPYLKALPDGRLFTVYGRLWNPVLDIGQEWHVTAATFSNGTWTTHDNFVLGTPGQHVCDPHMIDLPNGGSMLTVSVAQNSINTAHSNLTIEQLANKLGGQ